MTNMQPPRDAPNPGQNQASKISPEWLATAAAIAAGTTAYADVVRYENPGTYSWPFTTLDVTKDAGDQPFVFGPSSSFQNYRSEFYPVFSYSTSYQSGGDLAIFSQGFSDNYAAPLAAGTVIGPDLTASGSFTNFTVFEFAFDACEMTYDPKCYCYTYNCESGERGILPDGVETYLGVRFDLGNGTQYGWVKARRDFVTVEALAWGFQTDPGVPIRAGAAPCDADLDGDGEAAFSDLLSLIGNWGTDGPGAGLAVPFDVVDFADILALIANWGPCPIPVADAGGAPPAGTLAALAFGNTDAS